MKETKNTTKGYSPAFVYFVPELNKTIKVERVHNKTYVADVGNGLERIPLWQMKADKWVCKGKWDKNENM